MDRMSSKKAVQEIVPRVGRDPTSRRFNRNLALCAREHVPAEVMIEYLTSIMQGHGQAVLARDSARGDWYVTWPGGPGRENEHGELAATHEQKAWAWTQWRQAGYGMPAQSIQLEGELRMMQETTTTVELGGHTPAQIIALRNAVRKALAAKSETAVGVSETAPGETTPGETAGEGDALALAAGAAAGQVGNSDATDAEFTDVPNGVESADANA